MADLVGTGFPDAVDMGLGFRDGSLSPSAALEQALARLERMETSLNAFAHVMVDSAREDAAQATADLKAGRDRGPLHGIPVAIKDLIDVKGAPTGWGTQVEPPLIATQDATLVERLRAAGAVILGKTNLLEYAYGVAHPDIGQTNNPFDPRRTAGGSSGGSAAAVASGVVALAIGTDTGGSIRIPAAYCGIIGLKPSFDLVPLEGVFPLSWSLDHAGPLTRSVRDSVLALACLAGTPMPLAETPLSSLRFALVRQHFPALEEGCGITLCIERVVRQLRAAGSTVTEIDSPGLAAANADLVSILRPEASLIHTDLIARNPSGYAPGTRSQIEAGFALPATEYVRARCAQRALRVEIEALLAQFDALMSPSVPFVAPLEDPDITGEGDSEMLASGFANVTGQPSVSLPCGRASGLPVGLQLTGSLGRDAGLLSLARSVEAMLSDTSVVPHGKARI